LKNHDEFMQAVYAKATVKRAQIKRRNTMIRHAAVSFSCTFIVALAVVPVSRMLIAQPLVDPMPMTESHGYIDIDPIMNGYEAIMPQAARMVVVDNNANNVALHNADEISEVIDDLVLNNAVLSTGYAMGEPDALSSWPVIQRFDGAVTIGSVDGLLEFLAGLPQNVHLLQQLIEEYDEEFFQGNVLQAMPIGLGLPVVTNQLGGQDEYPDGIDPPQDGATVPFNRTAFNHWHANVDSEIMLLLLVPMTIEESITLE